MADPADNAGQSGALGTAEPVGGAGGSGATDGAWYDALPDGLRAEKSLESFKGKPITAVVESYVNAQKSFGSRLPIPQPNDKPEERAAKLAGIRKALGHPESPDKYAVTKPAYDEMGLKENPASLESFLKTAHHAGLTPDQVQALIDWQAQDALASAPDFKKDAEECLKALREGDDQTPGWGSTLPKYVAIAKRFADTQFTPPVREALERAGFYNNADFIRGLYRAGKELIEDGVIFGEEVDSTGKGRSAKDELEALMADAKGPYFDRAHPGHDAAVEKALRLRQFLVESDR